MSATAIFSDNLLSTPRHDAMDDPTVIFPSTPNKRTKSFGFHSGESTSTPSKSFRCEKKSKSIPTKPKNNNDHANNNNTPTNPVDKRIPILSPIPTEPHKTRLMIDCFDGILGEKLNRDVEIYSPLSDLESISPLSDISSYSPCLDVKKPMDFNSIPSLPWNPNGRLSSFCRRGDNDDEFLPSPSPIPSRLIELQSSSTHIPSTVSSSIIISQDDVNNNTRHNDRMFLLDLPPLGKKCNSSNNMISKRTVTTLSIPCHRGKTPIKPIIRNDSKCLNLIVSSGNGSLDDATIYATEINASSSHNDSNDDETKDKSTHKSNNAIPIIRNIWERITIPVNHKIKERHKRLRSSYFGEFYNLDEEEEENNNNDKKRSTEEDYALIRGYEFDFVSSNHNDMNRVNKTVRWNIPLHA